MFVANQINLYPGKKIGLSVTLLNELHKSVGGKIRFEDSNVSNIIMASW